MQSVMSSGGIIFCQLLTQNASPDFSFRLRGKLTSLFCRKDQFFEAMALAEFPVRVFLLDSTGNEWVPLNNEGNDEEKPTHVVHITEECHNIFITVSLLSQPSAELSTTSFASQQNSPLFQLPDQGVCLFVMQSLSLCSLNVFTFFSFCISPCLICRLNVEKWGKEFALCCMMMFGLSWIFKTTGAVTPSLDG